MIKRSRVALILTLVISAVVAIAASAMLTQAANSPRVAEPDARRVVQAFMGEPNLLLDSQPSLVDSATYEFMDRAGSRKFRVNKSTGEIMHAALGGLEKTGRRVDDDQAIQVAARYAQAHSLSLPTTASPTVRHIGDADTFFEIAVVEWQAEKSGVRLPSTLHISVNLRSGEVVSFSRTKGPEPTSLTPSVTEGQAIQIAEDSVSFDVLDRRTVLFGRTSTEISRLTWSVELRGTDGVAAVTAIIQIDAETGEIVWRNGR